ncbi:hypothetical protein KEJ34_08100 [Candidatus Bathyarchaeota archaeon]|nr:hypothetical protein [Candidatus Bathyarchaeota archaeon]
MAEKLKREFIELLEKDVEFRYTVAGYLGLSEILKRLDRLEEGHEKIWGEIMSLREDQKKLWEGQNRLWEEIKSLREDQRRLWENQSKLWENQNRLWEEVKALRLEQERMHKYMITGFRELSRTLGVTFEDHVAAFLEVMLEEMGYEGARIGKKYFVHEGEVKEVNIFCEEPLVIGEATVSIRSIDEAEKEIEKIVERVRIVEEKYGRKPLLTILSVARVTPEASGVLRTLAEKSGVKLVLAKEIEEYTLP